MGLICSMTEFMVFDRDILVIGIDVEILYLDDVACLDWKFVIYIQIGKRRKKGDS